MERVSVWLRRKTGVANNPAQLLKVLTALETIQKEFNSGRSDGKSISIADLIVLGGSAAIEKAAKDGGHDVKVAFTPGRADASQEQTDVDLVRNNGAESRWLP